MLGWKGPKLNEKNPGMAHFFQKIKQLVVQTVSQSPLLKYKMLYKEVTNR